MEEQKPLLKKIITYSGQELGKGKIPMTKIIDENGKKYGMFHTKKEGGVTKAYEQLGSLNMGQKVGVAYVGEMKTFTNEKGKEITYEERTVRFFADVPQEAPIKPEFQFKGNTQEQPINPLEANSSPQEASEPLPEPPDISIETLPL